MLRESSSDRDAGGGDEFLPFDADAHDLPPPATRSGAEFLYIGEGLTAEEFSAYVQTYDFGTIAPDFVILHHTAIPSTRYARYPSGGVWDADEAGLSAAQIKQRRQAKLTAIKEFYRTRPGWDRGPHLFIDDRYIWLFTPMREIGIHAAQGNAYRDGHGLHYSIGIEVVGYYEHVRWPEPVERLVGHCVAVLKRRLGTFELRYQPRAGAISSHRDYNKPQCPGAAITEGYYIEVCQRGWARLTTTPAPITADESILAAPRATPEQCVRYILRRDHGEYTQQDIANVIVPAYFDLCMKVGVDPLVAITQMIHETGNLTSWWAARPRRNPAGIGVNGQRRTDQPAGGGWQRDDAAGFWRAGLAFASWHDDAIVAHVGRLLAYALPLEQRTSTQQEVIVRALAYRALPPSLHGSASTLKRLGAAHNPTGQGWASPGTEYGERIAALMRAIVAT
jgi:hypothetical protein